MYFDTINYRKKPLSSIWEMDVILWDVFNLQYMKNKINGIILLICIFIALFVFSIKNTNFLHKPILSLFKKLLDQQNLEGEELGNFTLNCVFLCEIPILILISTFILYLLHRIIKRIKK